MSWWDIATTMLEENDYLKLSNMRNSALMGAAIQHWSFVLKSLTLLMYTNRHISVNQMQNEHRNSNSQRKKIYYPFWSFFFFSRQLIFFSQVVPSFAWSIFLRRYLKLLPHRLFFPQKLLWEDFSSEVLIFQTFLPVFNSIWDKNPSCRIICEKQTSMHKNAYRISDSQGKTK